MRHAARPCTPEAGGAVQIPANVRQLKHQALKPNADGPGAELLTAMGEPFPGRVRIIS
jgi:hypothetical protein